MRAIRLAGSLTALCLVAATLPVTAAVAQEEEGAASATVTHHTIESFDGTAIEATLFVPDGVDEAAPAPLVLRTHGWGLTRETDTDGDPLGSTLARLVDEGYVVLTWDSRGFGCSGGEVRINDPQVEGRDASALIDWAVEHAPVQADGDGDPLVGMTGASYAGGIQMALASIDDRVDALAPEIAWSDLAYSLNPGDVVKQGWVALLYALGTATGTALGLDPTCDDGPDAAALDPAIPQGVGEFVVSGSTSPETLDFFAKSSLVSYGQAGPVDVPTLVIQGSVDTLFDLTDGWQIATHVRDRGGDWRYLVFCGGHVDCPSSYEDADDAAVVQDAIVDWFASHLRGEDVDAGAPVTYRTNDGQWRDLDDFAGDTILPADGETGTLPVAPVVDIPDVSLLADAGDGGGTIPALPFTAASPSIDGDPRAATLEVARAEDGPLELVGIPEVALRVTGTPVPLETVTAALGSFAGQLPVREVGDLLVGTLGPLGSLTGGLVSGLGYADAPLGGADGTASLFVKLVHREAGEVVNLQEGAIRVDLTDGETTVEVPMPGMAYTIPEGDHLDLQVSTASLVHATGRTPAMVDVAVDAEIPVTTTATPTPPHASARPEVRDIDLACPADRVPDAGFDDVTRERFAGLAIDCVAWWDVAHGRTATTFAPTGDVTRGQMASFIARTILASGGTLPEGEGQFDDTEGAHGEPIERLAAAGIVRGYDDGTFRPDRPVRRDQMATFLVAGHEHRTGETLPEPSHAWFDDVADDSAHARRIGQAHEAGLAAGVATDRYAPARIVRRDQMALFLSRALDLHVDAGRTSPPDER